MKPNRLQLLAIFFSLLILGSACSLPTSTPSGTATKFPTPFSYFETFSPAASSTPTATATRTPFPSPTPHNWPPPYFGTPGPTQITPIPYPAPVIHNPDDFTILLLGSDRRASTFATDVMVVVNIQPDYNTVNLISVQRDFFAYIPGWRMNRINGAFQHGEFGYYPGLGAALMKDTMLYNLGIEIDRYILVDFGGFKEVIDTLGGVEMPVACAYTDWRLKDPNLDPENEDNWHLFTVPSGIVQMDGEYALWYARARQKSSDFDRNKRQQDMLRALFNQALRLQMISNLPTLYSELSASVVTDFTLVDALNLGPYITTLSSAEIRSYYIDRNILTRWKNPLHQEVQIPNQQALHALMAEALGPPSETEQLHTSLTIEIWNGTSQPGWDSLAAERLNYAGFDSFINPPDHTEHSQTTLLDFTSGDNPEPAQTLGALFNLDPNLITAVPTDDSPVDYLLILGADFDPCFSPKDIRR